MLKCPFCGERVAHQGRDNWFECPVCRQWICLRVNQNGSTWFESGVLANGVIQPVEIVRGRGQPARAAVRGQKATTERELPKISEMDLPAIQTQRQQVAAKLRELESM